MKKYSLLFVFLFVAAPLVANASSVYVEKYWTNNAFEPDHPSYMATAIFQAVVPDTMTPGQVGQVTGGFASKVGNISLQPRGGHECPFGGCSGGTSFVSSPGTFIPSGSSGGPTNNGTFTAPMTPGSYPMGFFAYFNGDPSSNAWCTDAMGNPGLGTCTTPFSYADVAVIVVQANPQCSDGLNNDNAQGADTLDPECHTDCNAANANSFAPNHTSETTPPNGTCPAAATLQLNGRAAFFEVVKNFFAAITTKAFAGQ